MVFWSQQRYTMFRLGLHLDASSGTHSAMVWQPLSKNAEQLNKEIQVQWSKQLSQLLPQQFNKLPYPIIKRLVCGATTNIEMDTQDWADVYSYGFGLRGFDQVTYALNLCVSLYLKTTKNDTIKSSILELDEISQQLITQAIIQQQPWPNITKTLNFTGKKAIDQSLRKIIKSLYTHLSPEK
jgi:tRNA(Met) C34 N-acetyltransferase TmcA